ADGELASEVAQRLARDWRTAAFTKRVGVQVEGGVVMLTGTVDRWAARRAAGHVAATTRGVRKVSNRIAVQPYPYPWEERQQDVDPEGAPEWDPYYFDQLPLPWIASVDA
ncbi:MAG: BON domain-containing protein, partial [Gemmatimonadetes bacterium]|nr:BON domain-containing protein [Gemmatimonadota bacterium]